MKKLLIGASCIALCSLVSAKSSNEITNTNKTENFQREKIAKSFIIKTKKFKVRIDLQPNGKYLYQSWGANTKITAKPSMIISNGTLIPDGSGGNYFFEFENSGHTYQVWRNYITDNPRKAPYTLIVLDRNNNTIVEQDAQIVKS